MREYLQEIGLSCRAVRVKRQPKKLTPCKNDTSQQHPATKNQVYNNCASCTLNYVNLLFGIYSSNESKCSVVTSELEPSYTPPAPFSTGSCKLYAILMALRYTKESSNDMFVIHTTRIDVTIILGDLTLYKENPFVREILETLSETKNSMQMSEILFTETTSTSKRTETENTIATNSLPSIRYKSTSPLIYHKNVKVFFFLLFNLYFTICPAGHSINFSSFRERESNHPK